MPGSKKTREYIIEKSAVIFNKQGYSGTSLSDITRVTGLTKGSIYGNFTNKNEVAIEVFRYNYGLLKEAIRRRIKEKTSYIEKLLVYPEYYRSHHQEMYQRGGCPIMNTALDADNTNEDLSREARLALEAWREGIVSLISMGIRKREFKLTDPKKFAHRMIASIEGGILLSETMADESILNDVLDRITSDIYRLRTA